MKEVLYVQPDPELGVPYDAGHFNISKTGPNLYNFHFKGEETLYATIHLIQTENDSIALRCLCIFFRNISS